MRASGWRLSTTGAALRPVRDPSLSAGAGRADRTGRASQLLLRPIRPEDGPQHLEFFNALDPEDVRFRMFMRMRELQPSQLARLTQIDYDREMAFIATSQRDDGRIRNAGRGAGHCRSGQLTAEFAIIVRSDIKGRGLGPLLFKKLVDYTRSRGTGELVGDALIGNTRVISLAKSFGFSVDRGDDGTVKLRLPLNPGTSSTGGYDSAPITGRAPSPP